jgi:hypothetical protein
MNVTVWCDKDCGGTNIVNRHAMLSAGINHRILGPSMTDTGVSLTPISECPLVCSVIAKIPQVVIRKGWNLTVFASLDVIPVPHWTDPYPRALHSYLQEIVDALSWAISYSFGSDLHPAPGQRGYQQKTD